MAKAKSTGIPGHYKIGPSIVEVPLPLSLQGEVKEVDTYIWTLGREEEAYTLVLKWIRHPRTQAERSENLGGTITIPSAAVKRLHSMFDSLAEKARHDRAMKATATRKEKGIVPFERKAGKP